MYSQDLNFIFSINSCGSVDWLCLGHDRNSECGAAMGHCILQKGTFLFCFSDFVCCSAVNVYRAAIVSFYATWNGSLVFSFM
jgi:hypothetical protein